MPLLPLTPQTLEKAKRVDELMEVHCDAEGQISDS